ncbi:MAG TPA: MBL fold metallo-hydrolase [Thermoplasmatales archaeon]|nr:MBL fold metallo-hydrolase [Thermoplasmatales archaeon]
MDERYPFMQVTVIPGQGFDSNVYVLAAEQPAIIDTGTGFNLHHLRGRIQRVAALSSMARIILTHEHLDHTGGVAELLEYTEAEVIMHREGADTLEQGLDWSATLFGVSQPAVTVNRRVGDREVIDLGSDALEVLHTPGHSPGSMCLYHAESRSLFSGDTVFADGGVGRTDFRGGNTSQLHQSIQRLAQMEVRNLYPGHGPHVTGSGGEHVRRALRTAEFMLR